MKARKSIAYPIVTLHLMVAATALAVAYAYSSRHLHEALQVREIDKLKAIKFTVESLLGNELQRLRTLSELLKENGALKASFAIAHRTGRPEGLMETMDGLRKLLHLDIFDALDMSGRLLVSADRVAEDLGAYQDVWGLEEALEGEPIMGTSLGPHGWAARSFIPILARDQLLGVLVIGTEISDELARRIAVATNTQVSFADVSKLLASSLPSAQRASINWQKAKECLLEKKTLFSPEESFAHVTLYTSLTVLDETMCLILQTSMHDVNELWRKQTYALAWVSLILLCAVAILGVLLTISLIRPLNKLRTRAQTEAMQLAPGEWYEPPGGDEVQVLIKVFDTLVESIHKYVGERDRAERSLLEAQLDLERRVTERTKELQEANESLEAEIEQREQTQNKLKQALTDLRTVQAQLIQSAKLASIGELSSGVAHELNQPLMVIRTTAQLMQKKLASGRTESDRQTEEIEAIVRNTGRMAKIIDHLRVFSRHTESFFSPVDLNKVVEDVFLMFGEQLRMQGIEVNKQVEADLPFVLGDSSQLEQVLLNLISNARDAIVQADEVAKPRRGAGSGRERKIEIQLKSLPGEESMVAILIKDSGSGIPLQHLDRIFDPFFTTKEVGKGTGLGLSISYGIVESHSGKIEIAETGPDGTSMRVRLPAYRGS